ncbi:hypothetical protein L7F22_019634 [Adiantum nelumboides]|nr:hypothetical protein [Adiantum nelumboides]
MANPKDIYSTSDDELDLLGIGFGPANLSLSIALRESQEANESNFKFHFVERQSSFAWHSSLLLPGAQLQVSPMKDLATMRDPTSSFTFTNYLHQQGRLAAFINREASIPSRRDWSAYLHWAAKRMEDSVTYGQEVVNVEPAEILTSQPPRIQKWRITLRTIATGETTTMYARNITVAVGGVPAVPDALQDAFLANPSHLIHSSAYLPSLAKIDARLNAIQDRRLQKLTSEQTTTQQTITTESMIDKTRQLSAPLRFAVVGSGQSAAEISLHLRNTFPKAHISLLFRASAIVPSDDSAFVNAQAFDPDRTDAFWRAGDEERKAWLKEYRRTNYSVVRSDVLNALHTEVYDQEIELGQPWPHADGPPTHGRLQIRPNTQIDHVEITKDSTSQEEVVRLTLRDLKYPAIPTEGLNEEIESFDAVFLGTGFKRGPDCMPFLKPLQSLYPRLDSNVESTKASLGFANEVDSFEALSALQNDKSAAERLRLRSRGITRDYRLVSYSSEAFTHRRESSSTRMTPASSKPTSPSMLPKQFNLSGSSTPRNDGDSSDSSTLADEQDDLTSSLTWSRRQSTIDESEEIQRLRGPKIESSIYFLGGNEATHGLSDSLLSIVAHRSGELTKSLLKRRANLSTSQPGATTVSSAKNTSKASLKTLPLETLEERVRTLQVS